jgi:hypothetical protein
MLKNALAKSTTTNQQFESGGTEVRILTGFGTTGSWRTLHLRSCTILHSPDAFLTVQIGVLHGDDVQVTTAPLLSREVRILPKPSSLRKGYCALWDRYVLLGEKVTDVAPLIFPMSYLSLVKPIVRNLRQQCAVRGGLVRCNGNRNRDSLSPLSTASVLFTSFL